MIKQPIIFIYPSKASFINNDIAFLEKKYTVKTQDLQWGNPVKMALNFIRQFFFLLMNVKSSKVIIISFAGYFSLLPVLFGKLFNVKSLIILNGTECVSFPNYNYGSLRKKLLRFFIKKSFQNATKLLPLHSSLIKQEHTFCKKVVHKNQGFKVFFPKLKTPYKVIPYGFDFKFWDYSPTVKKNGFITVTSANSITVLNLKGVDLLIKVAIKFPEELFTIVGVSKSIQKKMEFPKNVVFHSFLEKEELKILLQKHQFYTQLSINEGFGCALAEAMLCGCIPIVSNVGSLPDVIGKAGFIIKKREIDVLESKVLKLLKLEENRLIKLSTEARERICNNFTMSNREELFLQEITLK